MRHLKENDIHRLRDVIRACRVEGSFLTAAPNRFSSEVSADELSPLPDSGLCYEPAKMCCFTA